MSDISKFEEEIDMLASQFAALGLIPNTTVMHWLGKHNHTTGERLNSPQQILTYLQSVMGTQVLSDVTQLNPAQFQPVNPVQDPNSWFNQPGAPRQEDPQVAWHRTTPEPDPQPAEHVVRDRIIDATKIVPPKRPLSPKRARLQLIKEKRAVWLQAVADRAKLFAEWDAYIRGLRAEIAALEAQRD